MKLQRDCGLGVIKHIIPLIRVPNQYYVILTNSYICYCALLLLGRVGAGDKWFSPRPSPSNKNGIFFSACLMRDLALMQPPSQSVLGSSEARNTVQHVGMIS